MAHHGSTPPSAPSDLAALFNLGATGQFPEGKLVPEDEGEIRLAIGQKDGKVCIDFGKPVAWIGFTAEQAEDIADLLKKHGQEIRLRR